MNRITALAAAGAVGLGIALFSGAVRASADATPAPPAASDLNNDVQSGQSGPAATANDKNTAAEFNVDDGQVNNVEEQSGQTGDQQTGDSSAGQSGDQGNTATGPSTGTQGDSGTGTQGDSGNGAGAGGSTGGGGGGQG